MNAPDPAQILRDLATLALQQSLEKDERAQEEQLAKRREYFAEFATAAYDKASTFLTLVTGAGYAGIFTIWSWASPHLARWETLSIAALTGFSLIIFVAWHIFGMFTTMGQHLRFAQTMQADNADFDALIEANRLRGQQAVAKLQKLTPILFYLCGIPGVLGGLVLVIACIHHIWSGD